MIEHQRFNLKTLDDLKRLKEYAKINLPISENIEILKKELKIAERTIPNSLAIHPMEGCDGTLGGAPDELTLRRYRRFAQGGAGLLWVEASAVVHEGRANPRQLLLNKENKESFKAMLEDIIMNSKSSRGSSLKPYTVLQLTHSGRYSRPEGEPRPIAASANPYLDGKASLSPYVLSDDEFENLEDRFVEAAILAHEIGFDAVDIKSCHGYLLADLLASYNRVGRYGGSFENRTRFLLNVIDKINDYSGGKIEITLRLNAHDAVPYPSGWGVSKEDFRVPELSETLELVNILWNKGVRMINITNGNPYYNPHINRPFDIGTYTPPEHPIYGVEKLLNAARQVQESKPEMIVIATGFSWLRELAPFVASGGLEQGWFKMAGFGRMAFAYPDFANDLLKNGNMDRKKCCITCGRCSLIMRSGGKTGCPVRDECYSTSMQ